MNKVYKVIWSKVKNMWVVASELAKSHTKPPNSGVVGVVSMASLESKINMDLSKGFVAGVFPMVNRPVAKLSDFKITVAAIVKNEAENVPQWVQAARSCADEIVVVDTGSTDGTVERFRDYGINCYHYEWNDDFASAKNYMISLCHGDWIVLLDGDEWFREGCDVRKAIAKHHNNLITKAIIADWICLDKDRNNAVMFSGGAVRAFRNQPDVRYFRKVHENLTINYENFAFEPDFKMYHTGYSGSVNRSKHERNLRIMRTMFDFDNGKVEFPTDWRYIEDTYAGLGEFDKALWAADKMISYGVQEYSAAAWITKFNVLFAMRTPMDEMKKQFEYCFKTVPSVSGFRFLASIYFFRNGLIAEGLDNYIEGLRMLMGPQDKVAMEHTYWRMYMPEASALASAVYLQNKQVEAALYACKVCEQYCGQTDWMNRALADVRRVLNQTEEGLLGTISERVLPVLQFGKKAVLATALASSLTIGMVGTPNPVFAACCNLNESVGNETTGYSSTITGGYSNTASSDGSSVSGGRCNIAGLYYYYWNSSSNRIFVNPANSAISDDKTTITVGNCTYNLFTYSGCYTTVTGGFCNAAICDYASVSGGCCNIASGYASTVTGGCCNITSGSSSSISGGCSNIASGYASTVTGGWLNKASGQMSSVSGGCSNTASGCHSWVAGGECNIASCYTSSVSGGYGNQALARSSSVSGGELNRASGSFSSVSGGSCNVASGSCSSVSGGYCNRASGENSLVSGGCSNTAGLYYYYYDNNDTLQFISPCDSRIIPPACYYYPPTINISVPIYDSETGELTGSEDKSYYLYNDFVGTGASIFGGQSNTSAGTHSIVSGGFSNIAVGDYSVVNGGKFNQSIGEGSSIFGGFCNIADGQGASVIGGYCNIARPKVIYSYRTSQGSTGTITEESFNRAKYGHQSIRFAGRDYSYSGYAYDDNGNIIGYSFLDGYKEATVTPSSRQGSTVVGGVSNLSVGDASLVLGGCSSIAYADYSTAIGGGITGNADCATTALGSVAIGKCATTTRNYEVAIGSACAPVKIDGALTVDGAKTVTDGTTTKSWSDVLNAGGVSYIGINSATGDDNDDGSGAIGTDSIAVGHCTVASAVQSVSLGTDSYVGPNLSSVMGESSQTGANSVAIGSQSIANYDNVVSFGHSTSDDFMNQDDEISSYNSNLFRRLINVADGINDHDAVTVGQLNTALANVSGGSPCFADGVVLAGCNNVAGANVSYINSSGQIIPLDLSDCVFSDGQLITVQIDGQDYYVDSYYDWNSNRISYRFYKDDVTYDLNVNLGLYSSIVGGACNTAVGCFSFVGGGACNKVSGDYSSVVGGCCNVASGFSSLVVGGCCNVASGFSSLVSGGVCNISSGFNSVVSGGSRNNSLTENSSVFGGSCNVAGIYFSYLDKWGRPTTISPNYVNYTINNDYLSVCSITINGVSYPVSYDGRFTLEDEESVLTSAFASNASVFGGLNNIAGGCRSSIFGGSCNIALARASTIFGGNSNFVNGQDSIIVGGKCNYSGFLYSYTTPDGNTKFFNPSDVILQYSDGPETILLDSVKYNGSFYKVNYYSDYGYGFMVDDAFYKVDTFGSGESIAIGGRYNKVGGDESIIVGGSNNMTLNSSGSIFAGSCNLASASGSSIFGGVKNLTSGPDSSVIGGYNNEASCFYSLVSGGYCNLSNGYNSSITGGCGNVISSELVAFNYTLQSDSSSGTINDVDYILNAVRNRENITFGDKSFRLTSYSLPDGVDRDSTDYLWLEFRDEDSNVLRLVPKYNQSASISGGMCNFASGNASWAAGGSEGKAYANLSSAIGGGITGVSTCSETALGSVAIGKCATTTQDYEVAIGSACAPVKIDGALTVDSVKTITDGTTTKTWAEVLAGGSSGTNNDANGDSASVSGGSCNTASGDNSSVSGGTANISSGCNASVSGGAGNVAGSAYYYVNEFDQRVNVPSTCSDINSDNTKITVNSVEYDLYQYSGDGEMASVSGGSGNVATGDFASVSGGIGNSASGNLSSVTGGRSNSATCYNSSVTGGWNNTASGDGSSISSGSCNIASGYYSSVTGGTCNSATCINSSVTGGQFNVACGESSVVSGGYNNKASGESSSVSGGSCNTVSGCSSSISGGYCNTASGCYSSVLGGCDNYAIGNSSSVLGGCSNVSYGDSSLSGGGRFNSACGHFSTVIGGEENESKSSADASVVLGGYRNKTTKESSVVVGGSENNANATNSFIAGGYNNNTNTGSSSSIVGGVMNSAKGSYSAIFGGCNAKAYANYSTVIGGGITGNAECATTALGSVAIGQCATTTQDYEIAIGSVCAPVTIGGDLTVSSKIHGVTAGTADTDAVNVKQLYDTLEERFGQATVSDGTENAIAVGDNTTVSGNGAVAVGTGSSVTGSDAIAIGGNTVVNNDNSVAIGAGSNASQDNVVSVGHSSTDLDSTGTAYGSDLNRRIVNVADAVDAHDAVTKGQIDAFMADSVGTLAANGNYILKDNTTSANLVSLDTQLKSVVDSIGSLSNNAVAYQSDTKDAVVYAGTNGTVLRNVKGGLVNATSMEAVNGGQLYAVRQDVLGFADDIRANTNNIRSTNESVSTLLRAISSNDNYIETSISSKADASLGNLTDSGKRVLKSYAEDAVATYLAQQGLSVPAAPMATNNSNSNTLSITNAGNGSLHVGEGSYVNGTSSIAIGVGNQVNANNSGAFGDPSIINADESYVLGNDDTINTGATGSFIVGNDGVSDAKGGLLFGSNTKASAEAEDGIALGNRTEVSAKNSIALGSGSIADRENTLSIGNSDLKRKIVNVADGDISQNSSEVVTGAQLFLTNEKVQKNTEALNKKAEVDASNINTVDWATKLGVGRIEDGNGDLVTGGTVYDAIQGIKGNDLVQTNGDTITIGANSTATTIDVSGTNGQGRTITGVVTNANDASSAVNVGYVNAITDNIVKSTNSAIQRVDNKVNKVGANAAAIANLPTPTFDGEEKWAFAAGVGHYQGETAGAVGAFYKPTDNVIARVSGSFGNGDEMVGAGVAVSLNKGNTPTVSKAQLVRTINAQAEKINNMEASHKAEINAVRGENAELRAMVLNMQQQLNAMQNSK